MREFLMMGRTIVTLLLALATVASAPARVSVASPAPAADGDANAGAKLVQTNGCMGCHGAKFQGGIGPKLLGIEHKLTRAQITDFIKHPRAPMPDFGFSDAQIADIVAYLSSLDGGGGVAGAPVITLTPDKPSERATITVRFPGSYPARVTARAIMQMGTGSHHLDVVLHQTSDPHVWQGEVEFSMGGPWTIQVRYDDKQVDIPLQVGQ
ncbi:MAG: c-type cytochrome [Candidatus Eremiobacteraeota bacterium]|nr:c-type cytochrome [Candidatus Eremiobacteraeota bacterium]